MISLSIEYKHRMYSVLDIVIELKDNEYESNEKINYYDFTSNGILGTFYEDRNT